VLAALDALGYEPAGIPPARTARPLAGVIAPELDNPVFPAFAMAIEARLARHGFTTVIGTATIEGTHEPDYLTTFTERGGEAAIFESVDDGASFDPIASIPVGSVVALLLPVRASLLLGWVLSRHRRLASVFVTGGLVYSSAALVALTGGTIEAHSPGAGQGSEFVVRLPAG
jgi:hypothetical protein